MPFKNKEDYNRYMRKYLPKYQRRRKKELDSIVAEWTTLKDRKEIPPDPETEHRFLQKIMFLESENTCLRSDLEGTQLRLEIRMRR